MTPTRADKSSATVHLLDVARQTLADGGCERRARNGGVSCVAVHDDWQYMCDRCAAYWMVAMAMKILRGDQHAPTMV